MLTIDNNVETYSIHNDITGDAQKLAWPKGC